MGWTNCSLSCWINPKSFRKLPPNINDSKKLSKKLIEDIYKKIKEHTILGVSAATNHEIDKYGINLSNFLAIKRSLYSLFKVLLESPSYKVNNKIFVLIDGNIIPNFKLLDHINETDYLPLPTYNMNSMIKGDQKVTSISLASIVAKVTRDNIMKQYDKLYPEYEFFNNKGYGTKYHQSMLKKVGICGIHRKNFKPIATIYSNNQ